MTAILVERISSSTIVLSLAICCTRAADYLTSVFMSLLLYFSRLLVFSNGLISLVLIFIDSRLFKVVETVEFKRVFG